MTKQRCTTEMRKCKICPFKKRHCISPNFKATLNRAIHTGKGSLKYLVNVEHRPKDSEATKCDPDSKIEESGKGRLGSPSNSTLMNTNRQATKCLHRAA